MLRLVVDTCVLLQAISSRCPLHPIFQAVLDRRCTLLISNEILTEYTEALGKLNNRVLLESVLGLMKWAVNIEYIDPHYRFQLLHIDADDNKFVDCAICGNADFLITEDAGYAVLSAIPFPKINIISPKNFILLHLT